MKRGVVGVLVGTFLVSSLVLLVGYNLSKSRVLVLHSAARTSGWAQRVDAGIRETLQKNRLPVLVRWHYLAVEEAHTEDDRMEAATVAHRAIAQLRPDVVLAVDDEAQTYVARAYAGATKPRIVFAAIDKEPAEHGYAGMPNVSGVLERLPLNAVREGLHLVRGGRPARIAVIGAANDTGLGQMRQVKAFDWGPHQLVRAETLPDFAAWREAVTRLGNGADVLLVLSFGGLPTSGTDPKPAPMAEVATWIESNSRALPVGIGTSFVEHGGGLALAPAPRDMGAIAMRMSLDWLRASGRGDTTAPAVQNPAHYRVALRESALRTRGVVLPSLYVEAARLDHNLYP